MPLAHHDPCFGCGQTNLFGLMRADDGSVAGRCFIKQDHQGPDRATAHDGIIAAAVCEAMALACGPSARATALSVQVSAGAQVGTFLELRASVQSRHRQTITASANATSAGRAVAHARGTYQTADSDDAS